MVNLFLKCFCFCSGGYGGDDYVNSINIFCETAKQLCQDNECIVYDGLKHKTSPSRHVQTTINAKYAFVFSPHPGYTSSFEAKYFKKWGCDAYIRILPEKFGFSTAEIIASSNVSTSQCSTVGGQSLSVGKQYSVSYLW